MTSKFREASTKWDPATRYNWGFWDGQNARKANRFPQWCRGWQNMATVHFDKSYGAGFHEGWYGYRHAETVTAQRAEKHRQAVAA